jgi:hypothetical protein
MKGAKDEKVFETQSFNTWSDIVLKQNSLTTIATTKSTIFVPISLGVGGGGGG